MAIQLPNERTIISPKDPSEVWTVFLDFTDALVGKTVATVAWSCARVTPPAGAPESLLTGGQINTDAPIYRHKVMGGVPGAMYRISALVTTTMSEQIIGVLYLPIINK